MFRPTAFAIVLSCALGLVACGEHDDPRKSIVPTQPARVSGAAEHIALHPIARGLNRPVWVGAAPGERDGLWVAEQPGRIVRLGADGRRHVAVDLSDRINVGSEQGLLGMAFHPDFASNHRLFVHYSDRLGDTRVVELRARADGTIDPKTARELLAVDQPEDNHNGGQIAFGPDGRLYLGLGDGGGAFDPRHTAQNPKSRLGKLLAANVDKPTAHWQIVMTGLRNPWRFSFDFALGEVWIGDVGQDETEEVDRVLIEPDEPPKNLGWSAYEGTKPLPGERPLDRSGDLVWPVAVYGHDDGCSITGGVVYRGTAVAALQGRYIYGDFCTGALWTLRPTPDGRAEDVRRERASLPQLTHIGVDQDGELVLASAAGTVSKAVAVSPPRVPAR